MLQRLCTKMAEGKPDQTAETCTADTIIRDSSYALWKEAWTFRVQFVFLGDT